MERAKKNQNKWQQNKDLKTLKIRLDLSKELGFKIPKEKYHIIPIFIPHRGCKNECVFCNQKRISGELKNVNVKDVKNKIEEYLITFKKDKNPIQIAFFGGSFTGLEEPEMQEFLNIANEYIEIKKVDNIRISTRPDYITPEILKMLKQKKVKVIELGVQSMDKDVLINSKRGHSSEDVIRASRLIKKYGFDLGLQIMIGLPESNEEKEILTIKECIKLKPKMIRIYPVYVLKNSELYTLYEQKKYTPLSIEESLKRSKAVLIECIKHNINVIRIGLQTTEEINQKNKDIIGPVCDNYKEQILSSIAKDKIVRTLEQKKNKIKKDEYKKIKIIVPKPQINYISGNNKVNIKEIEDRFNLRVNINKN